MKIGRLFYLLRVGLDTLFVLLYRIEIPPKDDTARWFILHVYEEVIFPVLTCWEETMY